MAVIDIRILEELKQKMKVLMTYINYNTKSDNEDVAKVKNIIYKHSKECYRMIIFAESIIDNDNNTMRKLREAEETINTLKSEIVNANSMQEVRDIIKDFSDVHLEYINAFEYSRYWHRKFEARPLWNPTDSIYKVSENLLESIANHIQSDNELMIFSVECRDGENDVILRNKLGNAKMYGRDLEDNGAKFAKTVLNRVIYGGFRGATISNEVFDIVYCNPSLSMESKIRNNGKLETTNEEFLLTNSIKYLKPNGLFIYNIPFYLFTPSMALTISRELRDINVIKNPDDENDRKEFKFITILGRKCHNFNNSQAFNELTNMNYDELPTEPITYYDLNLEEKEIKFFRGSVLDTAELDEIVNTDGLFDDFYDTINKQNKPADQSPLLPFNIGQIGLILSSGSLDGIVEETDGIAHVIKGMTVKETETETEREDGVVKSTETIRNKVQITALGADGTIYNLT